MDYLTLNQILNVKDFAKVFAQIVPFFILDVNVAKYDLLKLSNRLI
jgi:hypothetical protein